MMTPQEIRTVTFDKIMRGYRPEDVDALLQQLAQQIEQLQAEKESTEKKLYVLAQKVEEYRRDEDNLKTALLNAQRMGENVIKEAKQKAEAILREAGIKADDITRAAVDEAAEQRLELERIKGEVAQFKTNVLSLYKQHIESLSTLPGEEPEEPEEQQEPEEPEAPEETAADQQPELQPVQPQPEPPAETALPEVEIDLEQPVQDDPISRFPDFSGLYGAGAGAQPPQAEEPTRAFTPAAKPKDEPEEAPPAGFEGFEGIKFSD